MRAALAARTPAGASSNTRHAVGSTPSFDAAVRKTAGCGLPNASSSAECAKRKWRARSKCSSTSSITRYWLDEATAMARPWRRHSSMVDPTPGCSVPGPPRDRTRARPPGPPPCRCPARPRVAVVPVGDRLVHEHALGLAARLDAEGHPEVAEHLDLGLVPEGLGVDEEAVHVEDGRAEAGTARRHRRPRCPLRPAAPLRWPR